MKNKIEVETFVYEVCPKTDGNYTYIKLYHKEVMCDTREKVSNALIDQNEEALKFVADNVKK